MVETQQMEDEALAYAADDPYGPSYIQDSDILDRPELFYGGGPGRTLTLLPLANLFYVKIQKFFSNFLKFSLNITISLKNTCDTTSNPDKYIVFEHWSNCQKSSTRRSCNLSHVNQDYFSRVTKVQT